MCLAVYLASDIPAQEVPWNPDDPSSHLESISADGGPRRWMTLRFIYYAGSHEGCGCGFWKSGESGLQLAKVRENYAALGRVVRAVLAQEGKVEVYACGEDDLGEAPQVRESIKPGLLEGTSFEFKQRQLLWLEPDAEPLSQKRRGDFLCKA
jgi:hypothetical protein